MASWCPPAPCSAVPGWPLTPCAWCRAAAGWAQAGAAEGAGQGQLTGALCADATAPPCAPKLLPRSTATAPFSQAAHRLEEQGSLLSQLFPQRILHSPSHSTPHPSPYLGVILIVVRLLRVPRQRHAAPPHHVLPHVAQLLDAHLRTAGKGGQAGLAAPKSSASLAVMTCCSPKRVPHPPATTPRCLPQAVPPRSGVQPGWRLESQPAAAARPVASSSGRQRTGLIKKSTAPCVTPRSTTLVSPLEDITAGPGRGHQLSIPILRPTSSFLQPLPCDFLHPPFNRHSLPPAATNSHRPSADKTERTH